MRKLASFNVGLADIISEELVPAAPTGSVNRLVSVSATYTPITNYATAMTFSVEQGAEEIADGSVTADAIQVTALEVHSTAPSELPIVISVFPGNLLGTMAAVSQVGNPGAGFVVDEIITTVAGTIKVLTVDEVGSVTSVSILVPSGLTQVGSSLATISASGEGQGAFFQVTEISPKSAGILKLEVEYESAVNSAFVDCNPSNWVVEATEGGIHATNSHSGEIFSGTSSVFNSMLRGAT